MRHLWAVGPHLRHPESSMTPPWEHHKARDGILEDGPEDLIPEMEYSRIPPLPFVESSRTPQSQRLSPQGFPQRFHLWLMHHLWAVDVQPVAMNMPPVSCRCATCGLWICHLWAVDAVPVSCGCATCGLWMCHLWAVDAAPCGLWMRHLSKYLTTTVQCTYS